MLKPVVWTRPPVAVGYPSSSVQEQNMEESLEDDDLVLERTDVHQLSPKRVVGAAGPPEPSLPRVQPDQQESGPTVEQQPSLGGSPLAPAGDLVVQAVAPIVHLRRTQRSTAGQHSNMHHLPRAVGDVGRHSVLLIVGTTIPVGGVECSSTKYLLQVYWFRTVRPPYVGGRSGYKRGAPPARKSFQETAGFKYITTCYQPVSFGCVFFWVIGSAPTVGKIESPLLLGREFPSTQGSSVRGPIYPWSSGRRRCFVSFPFSTFQISCLKDVPWLVAGVQKEEQLIYIVPILYRF
ncbi:uncharacterized protein [Nothobranchius furzeri]|uniref:uncharacterized protein n=1 Tax=Nothobranchius furzeri TaxID=105023 RepID=UPI003904D0CB